MAASRPVGERLLRACMALVSFAATLVPRYRRREWQREWHAELMHRGTTGAGAPKTRESLRVGRRRPPGSPRADLVLRSLGALRHAAWLRCQEWKPDMLRQDIRYAFRTLRSAPTFTITALLTLGVGIGANAVVFNMLDSVLLTPYPFADPERLVDVHSTFTERPDVQSNLSYPTYLEIREAGIFDDIAVWDWQPMNLRGDDDTVFIGVGQVTASLFHVMRAEPVIGRGFTAEEDLPGEGGVVVLTEGFWHSQYGADHDIVGRTIQLDGKPRIVIGVMPDGYTYPDEIHAWVPLGVTEESSPVGSNWLGSLARLKPDMTIEQANAALRPLALRLEQEYPDSNRDRRLAVKSLREDRVGDVRPYLVILLGAVGFLLLIVCANVANLMLARASTREREIAVRLALGASRTRLVRQLLTESLILSLGGLAIGFAFSVWAVNAIFTATSVELPVWIVVRTNPSDVIFVAGVALATTMLFGLIPALQSTRPDVSSALAEASGRTAGSTRRRMTRNGLVAAEVAISMMLLVGAGLMARSFTELSGVDPGFEAENRLMATMQMPRGKYTDGESRTLLYREIMERLAALPGVESAGAVSRMPIRGSTNTQWFMYDGQDPEEARRNPSALHNSASPDYFETMGIDVLSGRAFSDADTAAAPPVVLINDEVAARYFPGGDALGRRITFDNENWWEIVGTVGSVRHFGLDVEPELQVYVPYEQQPQGRLSIVVRTRGAPAAMAPLLRSEIRAIDPDQALYDLMPLTASVAESTWVLGFFTSLMHIFAAVAAAIAAVGIYGVTAYSVARRTQELGVRMALGAERKHIARMVIRQSMVVVGLGIVAGAGLAATQSMALESMLYEVSATDPVTFAGVIGLVLAVGFTAAWLPARRATRLDPIRALRND